jgi:hypothetical protein
MATRWVIVVLVVTYGLLHLLGAAKGLGWAGVTQLRQPISTPMGWAWLAAAALVVLAGILLAFGSRWWWAVGAVTVVASQETTAAYPTRSPRARLRHGSDQALWRFQI